MSEIFVILTRGVHLARAPLYVHFKRGVAHWSILVKNRGIEQKNYLDRFEQYISSDSGSFPLKNA